MRSNEPTPWNRGYIRELRVRCAAKHSMNGILATLTFARVSAMRSGPSAIELSKPAAHSSRAYPADREVPATVALTTLVTGLAMNHVHRGSYLP